MEKKSDSIHSIMQREGYQETLDPELKRAFEFADHNVDPSLIDHGKAVKMHKDSVKLSGDGVFYTLQGEGPTMGFPAVFVRLHVCNLQCVWCDAWYTWNPNTEEFWTESKDVSFEELAERIREAWKAPDWVQKRVIFTGGEPLIQRKQLDEVARHLWATGHNDLDAGTLYPEGDWIIEVETNGTLMPTKMQLERWQFNCSPKLRNSDNRDYAMVKPKCLAAINSGQSTFKFVVTSMGDLDEIEKVYFPHISRDRIIIMPQGVTAEEVDMNAQKVAEYCKEKGFRLMGRLQNNLWGAKRGV